MTSLPDVNVWLALLLADHVHRTEALAWWESTASDVIAFSRFTQMSILRLLTTAAVMNNRPLTMARAWAAYDRLFDDDRVAFLPEPASLETAFREQSSRRASSPKLWADAYLAGFANGHDAKLVTFDRALALRAEHGELLESR